MRGGKKMAGIFFDGIFWGAGKGNQPPPVEDEDKTVHLPLVEVHVVGDGVLLLPGVLKQPGQEGVVQEPLLEGELPHQSHLADCQLVIVGQCVLWAEKMSICQI